MTSLDRAREVLSHYLTQDGDFGDPREAANTINLLVDGVVETVESRRAIREGLGHWMTLRDTFAAAALTGLIGADDPCCSRKAESSAVVAALAYQFADAMLAARSASPRPPVAASPSGSPSPAPSKTE